MTGITFFLCHGLAGIAGQEIIIGACMDSKRLDWKLARVISSNTVEIRDVTVAN